MSSKITEILFGHNLEWTIINQMAREVWCSCWIDGVVRLPSVLVKELFGEGILAHTNGDITGSSDSTFKLYTKEMLDMS